MLCGDRTPVCESGDWPLRSQIFWEPHLLTCTLCTLGPQYIEYPPPQPPAVLSSVVEILSREAL